MTAFTGFCIGIIVCITVSVLGEREYGRMMYRRGLQSSVGGHSKEAREKEGIG